MSHDPNPVLKAMKAVLDHLDHEQAELIVAEYLEFRHLISEKSAKEVDELLKGHGFQHLLKEGK